MEIPCDPGATAPLCNRSAALADDAHLYGPAGSFIEPGLLLLCNRTAAQLAATYHDGVASSSCDSKVPESGQIVGVLGHMHTLGKSFRLTLNPGAPDQQILLDIPNWNFDWQMNYQLQQPLHVTAGQTVVTIARPEIREAVIDVPDAIGTRHAYISTAYSSLFLRLSWSRRHVFIPQEA